MGRGYGVLGSPSLGAGWMLDQRALRSKTGSNNLKKSSLSAALSLGTLSSNSSVESNALRFLKSLSMSYATRTMRQEQKKKREEGENCTKEKKKKRRASRHLTFLDGLEDLIIDFLILLGGCFHFIRVVYKNHFAIWGQR